MFAANRTQVGALVNRLFTALIKVQKIFDDREKNQFHANAVMAAKNFHRSVENLQVNIDVRMNAQILDRNQENRHIVKSCTESILYCGRQCIALRGGVEKLD